MRIDNTRDRSTGRRTPRPITVVGTTLKTRRALTTVLAAGTVVGCAVALPANASAGSIRPASAPVSRAVLTAVTPTSVGRLTPRGCVVTGTADACDLWAKAGTTVTAGVSLPIWGFAPDAASASTAPGPLLVVTQGDTVAITVHNGLSTNVSLALPGQHLVNGGGGDDMTGAVPGSTMTYTFTASNPGTFAYEAGHTADGARQVAMGLAGALVVLPTTAGTLDGNGPGNAASYPDTSYDDDAPLVLSEIDPALNTSPDPLTFDMRHYRPTYRLINGRSFPSGANIVATDQNHKVLVRYVNVGQQMHSMSVLGGSQVEVAQDGHPMKYSTTVTAESVDPGTTLDTLVTMPGPTGTQVTGDPAIPTKVAIYEANGALDNNAVTTGDASDTVGFGGMLAYLDTQAPVDITKDYTGPTAKSLAVSPNPSDATAPVTVTATISDATSGGSAIKAAEYIIDDAAITAVSSGTTMSVADTTAVTTTATGTIPASVLSDPTFAAGKHIVYVRGQDAFNNWGVVGSVVLNVPKTGPLTTNGSVTPSLTNGTGSIALSATGDDSAAGGVINTGNGNAEYFLDAVGANGSGTPMTVNRTATVVSVDATAAASALTGEGPHHYYVHVKDSLGLWGPTLDIPVNVDQTAPLTLAVAMSPPATNGVTSDPSNPGYLKLTAELRDDGLIHSNIVQAEAFIGSVKATGTGFQLRPIDGKLDSSDEAMYALIPLSQYSVYKTDQNVSIFVHGKDAAGNWGSTSASSATVILDRTAPVLAGPVTTALPPAGIAGIAITAGLTERNTLFAAEVWTGNTDPGVGRATPATIGSSANNSVTVYASFPPSTTAATTYHIRVRDQALNWSNTVATSAIRGFKDNLSSATAWNNLVGTTTVSTNGAPASATFIAGAAQPNPDENPSALGFQAQPSLSPNGARTGYVFNNTPVTASSYHARFQFTASTLTSGSNAANWVTIFRTGSANGNAGSGTEVFSIQFKGSPTGTGVNAPQLRAVVGTTQGTPIPIGTGNHTIQVDWANGTAASLLLTISGNGTTVTSTVGANVTTTIEAAQLGVSNTTVGTTNTVGPTGKGWFDTFLSVSS